MTPGIQEEPEDTGRLSGVELPESVCATVGKLAVTPKDFLEDSYEEARNGGLSDEEYVEIVGIVSRLTDMDVFARGIGVPLRPLPAARDGQPCRVRPRVAKKEMAWVPTVPNLRRAARRPPRFTAKTIDLHHPLAQLGAG